MATYLIAGGTCVVAVALVPTVARILSKLLPANDKPGTPPVREAGKTSGFKKVTHDSAALKKAKNFDTRGDALKLEAGEVTLFYEFFGEGGLDTIVLLSGAGIGADMFSVDKAAYPDLGDDFEKGVAAQLADKTGCRVLTIDYRGHGRSSYASDTAPSTDNTIALHALDIIAVLKQLGLTSGCHFVGTSLGYLVSFAVAGLEPSYVLSISGHGASLGPALGLVGPQKPLSSRCLQRCLGSKFFATATEGAALVAPKGLLFKVFCYGPGMDGFQKAFVASGHTNLQEVLPKLKIPVLTMYPVHDAGFYPFSNVEENAKLMTSAKANVVKLETNAKGTTCGHIVPWELPKKYCELVAENIKKAK